MRQRSEEETSSITPETVDSVGVSRLKKRAKEIRKTTGCRLADALEQVAVEHGFKNWNNVHRFASKRLTSSQIQIELDEAWSTNMFVEIKSNKKTYIGYEGHSYYEATDGLRINLSQVYAVEFLRGQFHPPSNFGRSGRFLQNESSADSDSGNCNVINFQAVTSEGLPTTSLSCVFLDVGDYHRVKRSIDELTAGKSRS